MPKTRPQLNRETTIDQISVSVRCGPAATPT